MNKVKYIIYCRKSSDSEDRQVQSIEDQRAELDMVVKRLNLDVIEVFEESMSAKNPGRPIFNSMLDMINKNENVGILCWKLNRLSRNPIDGGQIQWLLQQGSLQSIITPTNEYLPTDNVLMMSVELGMATQFSIDLSKDVVRGMDSKVAKGWRPGRAPLGYLNDKYGDKGEKRILTDSERFPLVRKMWDLMMTGKYSVTKIIDIANDEIGLRNINNNRLSYSYGYTLFRNTFYFGEYLWKGEVQQGQHEPMITASEFDIVQNILGKKGNPRPKHKRLPYTGLIVCGECGGMVTCDEKIKDIKATGKKKSYLYHRCTRRKKTKSKCQQRAITYDNLTGQIHDQLDKISIPDEFLNWALEILREQNKIEKKDREIVITQQRKNYDHVVKSMDNLVQMYISPENTNKELLSEMEYINQKNKLVKEKARLEPELRKTEGRISEWLEICEETFNLASNAKEAFNKGNYESKTDILRSIGQNFSLIEGKLTIELEKPFLSLQEGLNNKALDTARREPSDFFHSKQKHPHLGEVHSLWSG